MKCSVRIKWHTWSGAVSQVSVDGDEGVSLAEVQAQAERIALRAGWTKPRWWQPWRWYEPYRGHDLSELFK